MKRVILISLLMLLSSVTMSQTYYYNGDTAKGTTVTYKCIRKPSKSGQRSPVVTISNISNQYDTVEVRRLDGKPMGIEGYIDVADNTVMGSIVREVFSATEQEWFSEHGRAGMIFITSLSGATIEVSFMFLDSSRWATIPPDKYYIFEQKIKQRMKFIITDEERAQNIIRATM